ncbi:hypothetical protein DIPPA_24598 [Diplonema papillatum]|nr:hypothetical protein DIPPA_24598 [Diplonema papillatum]
MSGLRTCKQLFPVGHPDFYKQALAVIKSTPASLIWSPTDWNAANCNLGSIWKHEKFADTAAVMSAVVRMTNELPLSQKERTAKAWFKNDWQSFVGKRPGAPMEELKTIWKQDFPTLQAALDALQALQVPEPSPSRSKTGKELYAGKYGDLQAFAKRCLGSAWNEDSSTAVTACLTSIWKEQFSDLAAAEAEARARLQAVVADDIGDESVDECAAMEGAEHIDEGATKVDEEVVDAETDDTSTADTVAEPPKKRRKMVADIQALLRAQNLATTGTRAELESRLAQATGDVPSGDQEARFEARVIDHGWALVESPKRLFLESLESQGFTIDLATTTTTQYNMSCSYVTLYVASALQRNQCGPAHLPTVLQLQQFWRDVATPSMLHMTKARHSAVTDALTSEIFLGLTTNEVAAFCSHHKMRYISRGQHETCVPRIHGITPNEVCIAFVAESYDAVGHFFVLQFLPRQAASTALPAPTNKELHPFFARLRTAPVKPVVSQNTSWAAAASGYVEVDPGRFVCRLCRQRGELVGAPVLGERWCWKGAGVFSEPANLKRSFAEHVSGWRHVLSRRLVVDGWLHVTYASVVLGAARLSQIAAERVAAAKLGDTVVPSIVVRDPNQLRDEVAGARKIVTDEALSSQLYNMHMAELVCLLNGGSRQQALHNIRVLDLVGQMRPQKYTTDHHLHEMMGVWADLMRVKIACELQSNNASSLVIVLDGTNVKGMRKTEIYSVVARFFSRRLMAVDELPLGVFSFSDGDTSTGRVLYESVAQKLGDAGVHVARVTAVVSDKAANLSGHQTGLLGRLKSYANPKCVHLPDASHVLETAVGKAVTDTVMEKLPAIVEQTETHYRSSWKLTGLLLDFANQLGKPALSPATYMSLRWLPKVKQLLDRGVKMWPTWLQHMQDHPDHWRSADRTLQHDALAEARAELLPELQSKVNRKNVRLLHPAVCDLAALSLLTQTAGTPVSDVVAVMRSTGAKLRKNALRGVKKVGTALETLATDYTTKHRTILILRNFAALAASTTPAYGYNELQLFSEQFLVPCPSQEEWDTFKQQLRAARSTTQDDAAVLACALRNCASEEIHILMATVMVHARHDSNVMERMFSRVKKRVGDDRGNLSVSSLEDEMLLDWMGGALYRNNVTEFENFVSDGIHLWKSRKARRPSGSVNLTGNPGARAVKVDSLLEDDFWR